MKSPSKLNRILQILAVLSLLIFLAVFLMANREPHVVVVDTTGAPIKGAMVTAVLPSFDGSTTKTNRKGHARLRSSAPFEIYSIRVKKPGYQPVIHQPYSREPKPVKVVLHTSSGQSEKKLLFSTEPIRIESPLGTGE